MKQADTKRTEYLGDGVYASYDGFHIWLDLRDQDMSLIGLEPRVFNAMLAYREKLRTKGVYEE